MNLRALALVATLLDASCLTTRATNAWLGGDELRGARAAYATSDGGLLVEIDASLDGAFGARPCTITIAPGWRERATGGLLTVPRAAIREGWPDPGSPELAAARPIPVDASGRGMPPSWRWDPYGPPIPLSAMRAALRPPEAVPEIALVYPRPPLRYYYYPIVVLVVSATPSADGWHCIMLELERGPASPWRVLAIPVAIPILFVCACLDVVFCPIEAAVGN